MFQSSPNKFLIIFSTSNSFKMLIKPGFWWDCLRPSRIYAEQRKPTFLSINLSRKEFLFLLFNHFQKLYKPVKRHSDPVTSSRFYPVFDIDIVFTTLFSKIETVKVLKKKKRKKSGSSITC